LLRQPAVSPPYAVETPTAAYSFHVDACWSFFGETLFLPISSVILHSLTFSERFLFTLSSIIIHSLIHSK